MAMTKSSLLILSFCALVFVVYIGSTFTSDHERRSQRQHLDEKAAVAYRLQENYRKHRQVKKQIAGHESPFYHVHALDIDGHIVDFSQFRNKVVLVVNVASHDPKTEMNFKQLNHLYDKYHSHGLEILAFPCNQFGGEESGSAAEIRSFARDTLHARFRIMAKVDVNGPQTVPLYRLLKSAFPGAIRWNFAATFLINLHGRPVKRSRLTPLQLEPMILELLQDHRLPKI